MNQHKDLVIRALEAYKGDDFYRARAAFRGCTPEKMQEEYGQSGKTREKILNEYEKHETAVVRAIDWIKTL